jgi:MoxR-like ATPase
MPSDILGSELLQERDRKLEFEYFAGPIFTNLLLADEVNRTPPKTQSALLEAMQEHRVTIAGESRALPDPFLVVATQNPIEQEGTYPLPEAQLDRFMFSLNLDYPEHADEVEIVKRTTLRVQSGLSAVVSLDDILAVQKLVVAAPVSDHVIDYAVRLAASTRPANAAAPQVTKDYVEWGAGPRASQYLVLGAKALALLEGTRHARDCRRSRGGSPRSPAPRDHQLSRDRRRQEIARRCARPGRARQGAGVLVYPGRCHETAATAEISSAVTDERSSRTTG